MLEQENIIAAVRRWVESVVIGLNLCPFAKRELVKQQVRFTLTDAESEEKLLEALGAELALLGTRDSPETTLLILPNVLQDFYDYNQFLDVADALLVQLGLDGIIQIASFHPDYQFAGTDLDDAENYTNRSPWPILHLLREASIEQAIAGYPDAEMIPERNIALLETMGQDKMQALLHACFQQHSRALIK